MNSPDLLPPILGSPAPSLSSQASGEVPATGEKLKSKIEHFAIGDVVDNCEPIVAAIERFASEPYRNVYMPYAFIRPSLPLGLKGSEADIEAFPAITLDLDDEDASRWEERLPLEANYVLETSAGHFQAVYFLERAHLVNDAKPVATALKRYVGADGCSDDMSHVWRMPGTPNWPNCKKVAVGRPSEPVVVRLVKQYNGISIGLNRLAAAVPTECPRQGRGATGTGNR